mmetsp:Transcript_83554/g.174782  ORF Transcript_83554/g.174782 Transcript_83554/m.174782 type:complete len:264 (-) Transcript_83554:271-1062(-)
MSAQFTARHCTSSWWPSKLSRHAPLCRSQSWIWPLKQPTMARIRFQSTLIARTVADPPLLKSLSSSPFCRFQSRRPPSLEPDKASVNLGSLVPYARWNEAPAVGTWCSSSFVSFGSTSPHQSSCWEETGTPKAVANFSLTWRTVSSGLWINFDSVRPRMLRTTIGMQPSGTSIVSSSLFEVGACVVAAEMKDLGTLSVLSRAGGTVFGSRSAASWNLAAMNLYGSSGRSRRSRSKRACMNSCNLCLSRYALASASESFFLALF